MVGYREVFPLVPERKRFGEPLLPDSEANAREAGVPLPDVKSIRLSNAGFPSLV
jgi:hypothetical protein